MGTFCRRQSTSDNLQTPSNLANMNTFCEVCTTNPAALVCCADDAVMCGSCDESIHSANPVVRKHERVAFKSTSEKPNCDICQVNPVYVVCHGDRAFLCRSCDISIHSANDHVAKHQRFLMTGITVELDAVGATAKEGEVQRLPWLLSPQWRRRQRAPNARSSSSFRHRLQTLRTVLFPAWAVLRRLLTLWRARRSSTRLCRIS